MRDLEELSIAGAAGLPNIGVITRGDPKTAGARTRRKLERLPQIAAVAGYTFPSRDRRSSTMLAWLREDLSESRAAAEVARALDRPGVITGGPALAGQQFSQQIRRDLFRAELIALPLLLILCFWVFRGFISALLPVLVGGLAGACALGCIRLAADFFPISIFSLNIVLALGLGLGVDYSLLMVSRFREELSGGQSPAEGVRKTVRSAGKVVAFSSATIAASFSALLVFPIPFVRSIGVGGILVALSAGAVTLAVLPALFSTLGTRINALAPRRWQRATKGSSRPGDRGAWYRIARFVMRRPAVVAISSSAFLLALAVPSTSMRLTGLDVTALPASASSRAFAEEIREDFRHAMVGEIRVLIYSGERTASAIETRMEKMGRRSKLATPFPVDFKLSPRQFTFSMNPTHDVLSEPTKAFVQRLRQTGGPIAVTGDTASYMDTADTLEHYLPYALAVLLGTTLVIMFLATGSVILPIKALLMNALSLGAALGLLVLIFQNGRLEGILGYETQGGLVLSMPIVIGAGAFGLLTDYGLFLLMRIKEAKEDGRENREAIAYGLQRTGRIVTSAALLFSVAVGAFVTSDIALIKEGAIGIIVAVLLDAFVVRPLLVPSLMAILGRWNWWPRG
jgi:RND superfamily putative drug exporter